MIHEQDVFVEKKVRLAAHTPGNMPNSSGTPPVDRVTVTVGWKEENGGTLREVDFTMSLEEARNIDIGDRLRLTIDLRPIASTSKSDTAQAPETA